MSSVIPASVRGRVTSGWRSGETAACSAMVAASFTAGAVLDPGHVVHLRLHVDLFQDGVGTSVGALAAERALRVVRVAEGDRLRRAALLAGGQDVPVAERPAFPSRQGARLLDPLHA